MVASICSIYNLLKNLAARVIPGLSRADCGNSIGSLEKLKKRSSSRLYCADIDTVFFSIGASAGSSS